MPSCSLVAIKGSEPRVVTPNLENVEKSYMMCLMVSRMLRLLHKRIRQLDVVERVAVHSVFRLVQLADLSPVTDVSPFLI